MKDFTDISILLDRSGSMQTIKSDTLGGLNSFILQQKEAGDNAALTFVQFDSENSFEVLFESRPIKEVKILEDKDFQPRAMTPLFDALGHFINATGARLAKIPEDDRPDKVIAVILTDGYENASHEFSQEKVREMITHQQDKYNWMFVFIGADMDAVEVGGGLGIAKGLTINVSSVNVAETYSTTAEKIANFRYSGNAEAMAYTDEERSALS
jgi:hypothetical protein